MKKRIISLLLGCTLLGALSGCDIQYDVPPSLQSVIDPYLTTTTAEATTKAAESTTVASTETTAAPPTRTAAAQTAPPASATTVSVQTTAGKQTAAATNAPVTKAPAAQTTEASGKTEGATFSRNALPANQFSSALSLVADRVIAVPGEKKVPFRLMVFGNKEGFSMYGICLNYDSKLMPLYNEETAEATVTQGAMLADALAIPAISTEKHRIAYAVAGTKEIKQDGILTTCYFDIPENAQSGDIFKVEITLDNWMKPDGTKLNPKLYAGFIVIE